MSIEVDILRAPGLGGGLPGNALLVTWLRAALEDRYPTGELSLRIVDEVEGRNLNSKFRGRDYATNVLSFPVGDAPTVQPRPLGDLVICAPVVAREAAQQGKDPEAHWAHLCVHGALHLAGHDHEDDEDARIMEAREVEILARLGYQDPYRADA